MIKETIKHPYGWNTTFAYRETTKDIIIKQWKNGLGGEYREIFLYTESPNEIVSILDKFMLKVKEHIKNKAKKQ